MTYICIISAIFLALPFIISCYGTHELFNAKDLVNSKDKLPDNVKALVIFILCMIGMVTIALEYVILNMLNPGVFIMNFN